MVHLFAFACNDTANETSCVYVLMGNTKKLSQLALWAYQNYHCSVFAPLRLKTQTHCFVFQVPKNTGKPKQSFSLLYNKGTPVTLVFSMHQLWQYLSYFCERKDWMQTIYNATEL